MFFALQGRAPRFDRTAGFVAGRWRCGSVIPLIAAIPFALRGGIGYVAALFEAVSGFTTTGATVFRSLTGVGALGRLLARGTAVARRPGDAGDLRHGPGAGRCRRPVQPRAGGARRVQRGRAGARRPWAAPAGQPLCAVHRRSASSSSSSAGIPTVRCDLPGAVDGLDRRLHAGRRQPVGLRQPLRRWRRRRCSCSIGATSIVLQRMRDRRPLVAASSTIAKPTGCIGVMAADRRSSMRWVFRQPARAPSRHWGRGCSPASRWSAPPASRLRPGGAVGDPRHAGRCSWRSAVPRRCRRPAASSTTASAR